MNENTVCCGVTERAPSIKERLDTVKGILRETSAVLEKTLEVLRGGGGNKCVGDVVPPASCVMEDLEATVGMAEQVRRLAEELSIPFQG